MISKATRARIAAFCASRKETPKTGASPTARVPFRRVRSKRKLSGCANRAQRGPGLGKATLAFLVSATGVYGLRGHLETDESGLIVGGGVRDANVDPYVIADSDMSSFVQSVCVGQTFQFKSNSGRNQQRIFQCDQELGKGAAGKVFQVKQVGTDEAYALKIVNIEDTAEAEANVKALEAEHHHIKLLNDGFVKSDIFETFQPDFAKYFFSVERGDVSGLPALLQPVFVTDLQTFVQNELSKRSASEKLHVAVTILHQMLSAKTILDKLEIGHTDIKPDNFMFDEHGNLKWIDWNLMSFAKGGTKEFPSNCWSTTPQYQAPDFGPQGSPDRYFPNDALFSIGATVAFVLKGGGKAFFARPN